MTGCVVCDLDEGYCEFCPNVPAEEDGFADDLLSKFLSSLPAPDPFHPANTDPDDDRPVIVNRDPGDENDFRPQDPAAAQWVREAERLDFHLGAAEINARSYKATYRLGDTFFTRTILAFDSFAASAAMATAECREGETLVGLTELI